MSRRPSSSEAMPPQANKSRKISHDKSDSISRASPSSTSSASAATRLISDLDITVPDPSPAGLTAHFPPLATPTPEVPNPSAPSFDPQPQHDPRVASGYLPTPEPESQSSDILASAAQNITIMSDTPVSDIMSPPATSPAASTSAAMASASVVGDVNGVTQASSSTSPTPAPPAPRTFQSQADSREQVHAASGYRYIRDEDAPGYLWRNKKAQDEANRTWEQITDKDRFIGKTYGDVLMRG